jgi:hypothetical protein
MTRAQIWGLQRDYRKAAVDLDAAVRAVPDALSAHVQRAELLTLCPDPAVIDFKEAAASARRACELTQWENPTHLRRLAAICELAGNKDEAMRWREEAMRIERANAAQLPSLPAAKP